MIPGTSGPPRKKVRQLHYRPVNAEVFAYLEKTESGNFYEICVEQNTLHTSWGNNREGKTSVASSKVCPDHKQALKLAQQCKDKKIKAGFVECAAPPADPLPSYHGEPKTIHLKGPDSWYDISQRGCQVDLMFGKLGKPGRKDPKQFQTEELADMYVANKLTSLLKNKKKQYARVETSSRPS
jgi:predicted DNA-binding WGR domain protein